MCRLLIMTGLQDSKLAEKFMIEAKDPMSIGNNMGIGYTAVKSNGDFFTERWHKNDMFFDRESVMTDDVIKQLEPFKKRLPKLDVNYSIFGDTNMNDIKSVTMHTRYATCGREFENTHPFVVGDSSLVHNGVISNSRSLDLNKISSCDSEAALQSYIKHGVNNDIKLTQDWLDTLQGYWAFGIFSRDAQGNRILDITRNDASLYVSNIENFGVVIATTPEIIKHSARNLNLTLSKEPELIQSNMLWRFDATTGNIIDKLELKDSKLNRSQSFYSPDYELITGKKSSSKVLSMPVYNSKSNYSSPKRNKNTIIENDLDKLFDNLENDNIWIAEKLEMYDQQFKTDYEYMYFTIPHTFRNEEWNSMDFFDVIDELEEAYTYYIGDVKEKK